MDAVTNGILSDIAVRSPPAHTPEFLSAPLREKKLSPQQIDYPKITLKSYR
ncbi:hypothetical protein [Nostoc sp. 106C]|uniref:hypothetical protein n=1 Tax=Nostoc sp. 106C TaxID=1932667 RepID=UPI001AA1C76F|nr:hypothetical protein [Nostoc sp. 106C]